MLPMVVRLAVICPCVLLAGVMAAEWMPKAWNQSPAPPVAAVAAGTPAVQQVPVSSPARSMTVPVGNRQITARKHGFADGRRTTSLAPGSIDLEAELQAGN